MEAVASQINTRAEAVGQLSQRAEKLARTSGEINALFQNAENDCLKAMGYKESKSGWTFFQAEGEITAENEYGKYKGKEHKLVEKDEHSFYENAYVLENGQQVFPNMTPEKRKKLMTLLEGSFGAAGSFTLAELSGNKNWGWGQGEASLKIGTAEAHASLTGGFYVLGRNNEKVFAPNIDAKVGAGFSLLALTAAGTIGNEALGAYGDTDITVGKAEAKGSASLSILDEKGNLDIQANAKASAEATLVEVNGRAGVTVGGVDVGVTGGLSVGVGAHAEIGITDGVFKVDIGASLGIGVNIGFEVDAGAAIDAVCGAAKSVWDGFKSWFK